VGRIDQEDGIAAVSPQTSEERHTFGLMLLVNAACAAVLVGLLDVAAPWVVAYVVVAQVAVRFLSEASGGFHPVRLVTGLRLWRAMRQGEIVLHYQPKVSLMTGEVVGLEALARWEHPRRGILPPVVWIASTELPWLERHFMRHTLDVALRQVCVWRDEHAIEPVVAVNVTPTRFSDRRLPADVRDALERNGLACVHLSIELTEAALNLSSGAIEVANELNRMGVTLALDDFGVGHSSMDRLVSLPIQELKIDRRFVSCQLTSERDAAVVRAAVSLGHGLDLAVVAEGVETGHDVTALRHQGCDIAQGYYFSRPLPPDGVPTWMANHELIDSTQSVKAAVPRA
jgi:EAL domain-containing protein (putative c-di-GMP-specific phosphodiesterase class I)